MANHPFQTSPRARRRAPSVAEAFEPRLLLSVSLVADINTNTDSFNPAHFTELHGVLYFTADDGTHGNELWRTDGTPAGTRLVKDIDPRPAWKTYRDGRSETEGEGHADPVALTVVRDALFFYARDEAHGYELWKTDGTAEGTVLVKDVNPGPGGSTTAYGGYDAPVTTAVVGGTLLFTAFNGRELWRSDGTEAGTRPLKMIGPAGGPFSRSPELVSTGSTAYFAASDTPTGDELWRTDGTPEGTALVKDLIPGPASSGPRDLVLLGDVLLFTSSQQVAGTYDFDHFMWRSDGTSAGTTVLLAPRTDDFTQASNLGAASSAAWFQWVDADQQPWLARTDGTVAGTTRVRRLYDPSGFVEMGDAVYFSAAEPGPSGESDDLELWKSDGTEVGTVRVKDIVPGPVGSRPFSLFASDGAVYFTAIADPSGSQNNQEMWKTDGTEAGTVPVKDINPGPDGSQPYAYTALGDTMIFSASTHGTGRELWRSDGTEAGTRLLLDLNRHTLDSSWDAVPVGDAFYFVVRERDEQGLWRTDGTEAGTSLVRRLSVGYPTDSQPVPPAMAAHRGAVYFTASDVTQGTGLWKSDGTAAGTVLVKSVVPSQPAPPVSVADWLFFVASDATHGAELWKTDGTPEGTVMVKDISPGTRGSYPWNLTQVGDRLFFAADDSAQGSQLWTSDGTSDGTAMVSAQTGSVREIVDRDGTAFFSTSHELWRSDGTPAGTFRLADLPPASGWDAGPSRLTVAGDKVYFSAGDYPDRLLWVSDGTPEGTHPVPGSPQYVRPLGTMDGVVYFSSLSDGLYRTDGTAAGTQRLATGDWVTSLRAAVSFGGKLYLSGGELWETDGTVAGTRLTADIKPGEFASDPSPLRVAGDRAVFFADDGVHGREPWRLVAPTAVVGRHLFYNNSAFDDPSAGRGDDDAVAPDKRRATPGLDSSDPAFIDSVSTYSRGLNGVMIDVRNLPAAASALSADDFDVRVGDAARYRPGPAPQSISVRRGAGAGGSDRITLTWPDNAIQNQWLRVTLKATEVTGLAAPSTFSFGQLTGDTGNGVVNALDLGAVKRSLNTTAGIDSRVDFNRDGRVNALDLGLVRANLNRSLARDDDLPPGASTVFADGAVTVARAWDEEPQDVLR